MMIPTKTLGSWATRQARHYGYLATWSAAERAELETAMVELPAWARYINAQSEALDRAESRGANPATLARARVLHNEMRQPAMSFNGQVYRAAVEADQDGHPFSVAGDRVVGLEAIPLVFLVVGAFAAIIGGYLIVSEALMNLRLYREKKAAYDAFIAANRADLIDADLARRNQPGAGTHAITTAGTVATVVGVAVVAAWFFLKRGGR
jgi:hypothetical protein